MKGSTKRNLNQSAPTTLDLDYGKLAIRQMIQKQALKVGGFLVGTSLMITPLSHASPTGGEVVAGEGSISEGEITEVVQDSQTLAIEWDSFNVDVNEVVNFIQPNSSATVFNQILDGQPSQIFGAINANGHVILINAAGVIFGPDSMVDVGALTASGLNISTQDFLDGNFQFTGEDGKSGIVINRGLIKAATGGEVLLLGKSVSNEGIIEAELGQVQLAAGNQATLAFDPRGLIRLEITEEVKENLLGLDSAVSNSGSVEAAGGKVLLTGSVAKDLFSQVVNNDGVIKVADAQIEGGSVHLIGAGGEVVNQGVIDASGQLGGEVKVQGDSVVNRGDINADGFAGGGKIAIQSEDLIIVEDESELSAQGLETGGGGFIELFGVRVGLFDKSKVNASGNEGGGKVLVGGNLKGSGPQANAEQVDVGADVEISVDAIESGDGGTAVVWSDEATDFKGTITAKGGESSGDGGFVEVSSKKELTYTGLVDTRAPQGEMGMLLLDPENWTIRSGAGTNTSNTLYEENIEAMVLTSSVQYDATIDITIEDLADDALTLTAPEVTDPATPVGTLRFEADSNDNGTGSFTMNAGDSIVTNGHNISIKGADVTVGTVDASGVAGVSDGFIQIIAGQSDNETSTTTVSGLTSDGTITLTGGDQADSFELGDITNYSSLTINAGGSSSDSVSITTGDAQWNITGADSATITSNGVASNLNGVESFQGGSGSDAFTVGSADFAGSVGGGEGANSLTAGLTAATWAINGADSGTVQEVDNQVAFNDIQSLVGTSGVDTFNFTDDGSISTNVNGGGNTDTASFSTLTADHTIQADNFTSVERIVGSAVANVVSSLQAADQTNVWDLDLVGVNSLNRGTSEAIEFSAIDRLVGGSEVDTFNFHSVASVGTDIVGGDGDGISDIVDLSTVTGASADLNNLTAIEVFNGGSGNTLVAADDVENEWEITGTGSGTIQSESETISFNSFTNITGGDAADNFVLNGGEISGSIRGEVDGEVTTASDEVEFTGLSSESVAWNLSGATSGNVDGSNSFTGIESVQGGEQSDTFVLADGSNPQIHGGNGTDRVDYALQTSNVEISVTDLLAQSVESASGSEQVGVTTEITAQDDQINNWEITGNDAGVINRESADEFRFDTVQQLVGGNERDVFTLQSGGAVSDSINGAGGNNEIVGADTATDWTIDGENSGSQDNIAAFSNINSITGGSAADDFQLTADGALTNGLAGEADGVVTTGSDAVSYSSGENTWTIDGEDSGSVNSSIAFSGIENLQGGTQADRFNFTDAGRISGTVTGGGGDDVATIQGNNDWTIASSADVRVNKTSDNALVANLSGIQRLTGGDGNDRLSIGVNAFSGTFDGGDGSNSATADSGSNVWEVTANDTVTFNTTLSLENTQTITGGINADRFNIAADAAMTNTIDGGEGVNTIDYAASSDRVVNVDDFNNIDRVIGGNDFTYTLAAGDGENNWEIGSGGVNQLGEMEFEGFQILQGGTGRDSFVFSENGDVTLDLIGGDNLDVNVADEADYSATNSPSTILVARLDGVEVVRGAATDSLQATDNTNQWTISGANEGTLSGGGDSIDFFGIGNLIGGGLGDAFQLLANATIGSVNGGSDNGDSLSLASGDNTWNISGEDEGNVEGRVNSFADIETLAGGTGLDSFVFADAASITGQVTGGDEEDTFNFSDYTTALSFVVEELISNGIEVLIGGQNGVDVNDTLSVAGDDGSSWNIFEENGGLVSGLRFASIENLSGDNGADNFVLAESGAITGTIRGYGSTDSLTGLDETTQWNISDSDSGSQTYVGSFEGIDLLQGGSTQDQFNIADSVAFAGEIRGGNGAFEDTVSFAGNTTAVAIGLDDFAEIERIVGSDSVDNDQLLGNVDGNNEWIISGSDSGSIDGLGFSSFETLVGGNLTDNFSIQGAGSVSGQIRGGEGNDTLTKIDGDNDWLLAADDEGSVNGTSQFVEIENLVGGSGIDSFAIADGASLSGSISGGGETDTLDYSGYNARVEVDLENAQASGLGEGFSSIEALIGFESDSINSQLTGKNQINAWVVDGISQGSINSVETAFVGFSELNGGSAADSFVFSDGASQVSMIDGGDAGDYYQLVSLNNLDSLADTGATGDDSLVLTLTDTIAELILDNTSFDGDGQQLAHSGLESLDLSAPNTSLFNVNGLVSAFANSVILNLDQARVFTSDDGSLATSQLELIADRGVELSTQVEQLTVSNQSSGNVDINQDGDLSALDLDNGSRQVTLTVNGAVSDSDDQVDINSGLLVVSSSGGDIGSAANPLQISATSLSTQSSGFDQYFSETDGLTGINLNSGSGSVSLVSGGEILDSDSEVDLAGGAFTIEVNGGDLGSSTNPIEAEVDSLSATTPVGSQYLYSGQGLVNLNLITADSGGELLLSSAGAISTSNDGSLIADEINIQQAQSVHVATNTQQLSVTGVVTDAVIDNASSSILTVNDIEASGGLTLLTLGDLAFNANSVAGSISLSGNNVTLNQSISAASLEVIAQGDLNQNADISVTGGVENTLSANLVSSTGSITMLDGTVTRAADGEIRLAVEFGNGGVAISQLLADPDTGSVVVQTDTGDIFALGLLDVNNPDVRGKNVSFLSAAGTFATFLRPILIDTPSEDRVVVVLMGEGIVYEPDFLQQGVEPIYNSSLRLNASETREAVKNIQQIQVQELVSIDPAIFTNVKNYEVANEALELPEDQKY